MRGELLQALRVYKAKVKIVDKSNAKSFTAAATTTTTTAMTEATAVALGENASSTLPTSPTPHPSSYAAKLSAYFCHCNAINDVADFHGQI